MNIIIFGAPGAGKGTQCKHIVSKYGMFQLSTGDVIRREIAERTDLGLIIQPIVEAGKLPDSAIVNKLVEQTVHRELHKGIVFDGYPRTLDQGLFLSELLKGHESKIDCIILLEVDENLLIERLLKRFSCVDCGEIYSASFNAPKVDGVCDKCGGSNFVHRADDNEEVIRTRFESFRRDTKDIIQYYDEKASVIRIDGNQPIAVVTEAIDQIIEKRLTDLKSLPTYMVDFRG